MPAHQPGEQAVGAEAVRWVVGPSGGAALQGSLFLPNLRLVFEGYTEEQVVGYIPRTMLDLHLSRVTNVGAVQSSTGNPLPRVEAGVGFVYTFAVKDLRGGPVRSGDGARPSYHLSTPFLRRHRWSSM